jgi:DNA-binding IscR family transcriptional regulator
MSAAEWAKMPKMWITRGDLKSHTNQGLFAGGQDQTGDIQAYKTFICIALNANYKSNEHFPKAGSAMISYTDLETMTGASRVVVVRGVAKLQKMGLIDVDKSSNTNTYTLKDYDVEGASWVKLPKRYLLRSNDRTLLADLVTRQRVTLHSLKLYLVLLAFQDGQRKSSLISYDKIEGYTGISRRFIARAISNLVAHDLIHVRKGDVDPSGHTNPPNEYIIRGFGYWKSRDSDEFEHPDNLRS